MIHHLRVFVALFVLWLLLSGQTGWLFVSLGALAAAGCAALGARAGSIGGPHPFMLYLRFPAYLLWLLGQMLVFGWRVALMSLGPRPAPRSRILRAPMSQRSGLARLLHANSITATPGTISIDMDDEAISVHVLDAAFDDADGQAVIDRKVRALEEN